MSAPSFASLDCSNFTSAASAAQLASFGIANLLTKQGSFVQNHVGITTLLTDDSPEGGGGTNPLGSYLGPLFPADYLPAESCNSMAGKFMPG